MSKLSIKDKKPRDHSGKEAAMKAVMREEDYLDGPITNGRVDLDKRIHKSLKGLGTSTTTDDNKTVSMRMLMTEALLDLFEKYEAGEGKYKFDEDEDWSWSKRK
ncbi:hypothetical protein EA007_05970 [Vibrio anguillarum]|uniref:hypothetical protein n=1 Tax=Vibrio anguillarum TaxID=55601 RepID=UPI00188ADB3B|nr:hypothetical protein [Vibrio anguillarum]MBF4250541.1 hypothetical protein [Vibrio anguillarum]CAK2831597.1 hypothetical protein VCRA2119O383_260046 [Vibrio crassostreae]